MLTILVMVLTIILFAVACKKTTEQYNEIVGIEELMPLSLGKKTYFRLDSGIIVLQDTNTIPVINRYLLREEVGSIEKNNLNQPMWKINRYLNKDTSGNGQWIENGHYFVTIEKDQILVTENTLRFIKLVRPVREGFNWNGNSYIADSPYARLLEISFPSIETNIRNWRYNYTSVNARESMPGLQQYDSVTTVEQINSINNIPPNYSFGSGSINASFASKELSVEKYAKGIGLIFREQELWEFQDKNNSITIQGFFLKQWRVNR